MSDLTPSQQRRVDGICHHIKEYLTLRFAHAERVNQKIGHFVDDLKAQLLVNLREVLTKGKAWGAEKVMIADVLCGDDLNKRYSIFNLTGQYSILHEVISALDEHEAGADAIRVTNMRDLYQYIDPSIGDLIELAQTWIWWDLPDAVNLQAYQGQLMRIRRLADLEITDQVIEYYRGVLNLAPDAEITRDVIIGHEWRRLNRLITEFDLRRRDDLAHTEVLKRDIVEATRVDKLVLGLASEIQTLQRFEKTETFDKETVEEFARRLAADPAHISHSHVLEWQREHVAKLKADLHTALMTGQILGHPYNFKNSQLEKMRADMSEVIPIITPAALEAAEAEEARMAPLERGPIRA